METAAVARKHEAVLRAAREGMTRRQIAELTGYSYCGIRNILKRHAVSVPRITMARSAEHASRVMEMAALFRNGVTLQAIGIQFGLTRERVRQLLKSAGVARGEGGYLLGSDERQSKKAERTAKQQQRCEQNCLAKWGLSRAEMEVHRRAGLVLMFSRQRAAAGQRGIAWCLAFAEWLSVWTDSGKLTMRGRGKGKYVMSRNGDAGGYEIGNVSIKLATDNSREAVDQWRGKTKAHKGVHCLYPGSTRPFVARVAHKNVGRFATEEEAATARKAYCEVSGFIDRPRGRGYTTVTASNGRVRFQAQCRGKYLGTFGAPEEAIAARNAFLARQPQQAA
jgi:hypothetical protein